MSKVRSISGSGGTGGVGGGGSGGADDGEDREDRGRDSERKHPISSLVKKELAAKKAAATRAALQATAVPSKDGLDAPKRPRQPVKQIQAAGASGGLPMGEGPGADSGAQRAALQSRIQELEGAFKFMGTGHPDYERIESELLRLKMMLEALGSQ